MRKSSFKTRNVDLASFLMLNGIEMGSVERSLSNPNIVEIVFNDPTGKCIDLERVFLNSDFKKFRDINKYLLSKIHEKLKE